ncbi:MAG: SDR family NAD(P)-dependent oxidoreductase [Chitinophagaceae bacterium]
MQKKIVIIGASSGIGRRMAELYLEKGHQVGITGRRNELLNEIKQQHPQQTETECFDITETGNISHLEALVQRLGGLDILVISAGTGEPSGSLDWDIDKTTVATNVNGFTEIANWAFNHFIQQGHGHLAVISSVAAIRGGSWAPAYNASKAFQSRYFEGLQFKAAKMKKKKVFITRVEPGFVKTKMAKSHKLFWVVPVEKAARQIITAIEKGKRRAFISRRWALIGWVLKWIPHWLYRKVA